MLDILESCPGDRGIGLTVRTTKIFCLKDLSPKVKVEIYRMLTEFREVSFVLSFYLADAKTSNPCRMRNSGPIGMVKSRE